MSVAKLIDMIRVRWWKAGLLFVSAFGLASCGGTTGPAPDTTGGGSGGVSPGGAQATWGGGAGAGSTAAQSYAGSGGSMTIWPQDLEENPPSQEPLACPSHEPLNAVEFGSLQEKQQAMVGTWLQCSVQGIGPQNAAGLRIAPDGKFEVLVRDADGELVPGVGVRYYGRVEIDTHWINFVQAGSTWQSSLLFSDENPYRMYASVSSIS